MTERVDIGCGHWIERCEYQGEAAGVELGHTHADGWECLGWVPFRGSAWSKPFETKADGSKNSDYQCWDVVCADPLTLSPSIKRRGCGDHGHIRKGCWVPEP